MSDGRDQGRDSCGATADEEFGDFDKRGGDSTAKDERFDSGIASLPEEIPREPTMSDALRQRGLDGDTILHQAIIMKVPDAVPLALIQLADDIGILNLQNDLLQTPLHLAVVTERPAVVQKLVESGSAPWIQDMQGNTPLHLACDLTTSACLHAIVHSVPPAALTTTLRVQNYPKGLTCLHVAIMKQDLSMVEDLLQLGVDIDAWEPCGGRAALHLAVEISSTAMVDCLLSHGACVNSRMWDGCTPLHLAVGRGHEPLVKLLYKHGADYSLENLEHDCPSDLPMCAKLLKTVLCLEDIS